MNIDGSLSIGLEHKGKLWRLVASHHETPLPL